MIELGKGVELDMNKGEVVLKAKVGFLLEGPLKKLEEDIQAGKVDPIPGTDMDKVAMLQALVFVKKELGIP